MQRSLSVRIALLYVLIATIRAKPSFCANRHFCTKPVRHNYHNFRPLLVREGWA